MKKIILSMLILVAISSTVFAGTWTDWEPKYEGIWYRTYEDTDPLSPQSYYAIRIDLENPNIDFFVSEGNGGDPDEFTRQTVSDFMDDYLVKVAVNANFFNNDENHQTYTNANATVISGGTRYSNNSSTYPELWLSSDNMATMILTDLNPAGSSTLYNAVAGICWVVQNGENVAPEGSFIPGNFHGWPNARTSYGLTADQRFLIILTVDGGGSLDATGATSVGLGNIMLWLGCDDAIMMDGGGSTQLCGEWAGTTTNLLNVPDETPTRTVAVSLGADSSTYNPQMCVWTVNSSAHVEKRAWSRSHGWWAWGDYGAPTGGVDEAAAVSRIPECIDLFALQSDGDLYRRIYQNNSWGGWVSIGAKPSGVDFIHGLDVCARGENRIDMAVMGSNGHLYRKSWSGSTWSGWIDMGSGFDYMTGPTVVAWSNDRVDFFARKSGGNIYHQYAQSGSGWSGWITRTCGAASGSCLEAVSDEYGRIYVFYLNAAFGGSVRYRTLNSSNTWSSETNLGGNFSVGAGACSYEPGILMVTAKDYETGIFYKKYLVNGNWDASWSSLSGSAYYANPDCSSWTNDTATHFPQ